MLKKLVSMLCIGALLVCSLSFNVFAGYTQPTSAETQFSEDFEAYQLINDYDSSRYLKIDTTNGNTNSSEGEIYCGIPSDGDYSDTAVYPYGTASVYEGNLDDSGNTYVHDYKYKDATSATANKVNGGTVNLGQDDGWYGYTNSVSQQFKTYQRRLAVFGVSGTNDVNKTQYAILEARASSNATYSEINRNNISLDGYSYLTARVSLSSESGYGFTKAGIAFTKNPTVNMDSSTNKSTISNEGITEVVYFVPDDEAKENTLDVMFGGQRVAEVVNNRFAYSGKTSDKTTTVTTTGEWYTIQYRIYKGDDFAKHKITIIDDKTKSIVYESDWKKFNNFDLTAITYGVKFYSQTSTSADRTCMRLDDISFYNGEFKEDFNSYTVDNVVTGQYGRGGNAPKGNMNLDTYKEKGVYEGNMAKNVIVSRTYATTTDSSTGKITYTAENTFGNITNWQGYVKNVKTSSITANVGDIRPSQESNYPCSVRPFGTKTGTNALQLRANASKSKAAQTVYAGMENVDFSDKTTISAQVKVHQVNNKGETFKFQLTKGKNTFGAKSDNYEDTTSITAKYDVFTMTDDGKIKVGEKEIGTYDIGAASATYCYNIEYTVNLEDKQNPKHSLKIYDADTNPDVAVATLEETAMNLTEGDAYFNFDNDVTGFRFVADAPYTSSTEYGDITVCIDDVKVSKTLAASVTNENSIKNAVYNAESKTLNCSIEMVNALASGTVVFAVYNKADNSLANIHTLPVENLVAGNNDGIKITDLGEYDAQNYYGKVFLWNSLTNITPYAKVGNVDFN